MAEATPPRSRVVIVDDSRNVRKFLRRALERLSWEVVAEGQCGDDVLPLYEEFQPDIIIVDLIMPGRDGVDAIRDLVKRNPSAVVIVCSGMSLRERGLASKKAGATQYLVKPFEVEDVRIAMRRALANVAQRAA